jgi:hypothetical protein
MGSGLRLAYCERLRIHPLRKAAVGAERIEYTPNISVRAKAMKVLLIVGFLSRELLSRNSAIGRMPYRTYRAEARVIARIRFAR